MDEAPKPRPISPETPAFITAAIAMTWAVMVYSVRVYLRISIKRSFAVDDIACSVGMLLGIGSTAAAFVAMRNGLGKPFSSLTPSQLEKFLESTYAASLLYIAAICASKCSTTLLVSRLRPARNFITQYWLTAAILIWGVISTMLIAFVCDLPRPWDGRCSNVFVKWTIIEAFSCGIEVVLFSLAVKILWDLQMAWKSKATVLSILATRLLIIPPTAVRIHYLNVMASSRDPLFEGVNLVITTQIVLQYSLMAATFPSLKPFLAAFDKELYPASHLEPTVGISFLRSRHPHDNKGYVLHSIDKDPNASDSAKFSSKGGSTRTDIERAPIEEEGYSDPGGPGPMIIRKTQEWEVTHETKA